MQFTREKEGKVVILTPQATSDPKDPRLVDIKREILRIVEEGDLLVALDLGSIDLLTSTEVGAIIGSVRHLNEKRGALVLCGLSLRLAETLFIIRMDEVLPFRITRQEAVRDLQKVANDNNRYTVLINANPPLDDIRKWWDGIVQARLQQPTPASGPAAAAPSPASSAPAPAGVHNAAVAAPARRPELGTSGSERNAAAAVAAAAASAATALAGQTPIDPANPLAQDPDTRDWLAALEVIRTSRDLCAAHRIAFNHDMTFSEFLGRLAESMSRR